MKSSIVTGIALSFLTFSAACSSQGLGGSDPSGGNNGSGGKAATGGVTGSGGEGRGGAGAGGTGGSIGSGGTSATGGQTGSGGKGTGGTTPTGSGGVTGSGGATDGGQSGTVGTGGRSGRDGGPGGTGSGGRAGNSGTGNTGGGLATGGSSGGGSTGTGGGGAATPSAGCGKSPTLTSGSRTIQSGGGNRSYILRIPSGYDNHHPYRLVFAFHWVGGTMTDIDGGGSSGAAWSYYGLQAQAENSTIFVAPQGISNGWGNSGGQDITFVDDMIKLIEGDLCVDTSRIFAMGFSYGGGMSYAIACARAKVFRAVAVYSGAQLSGCDGGKDPIAYLGIHGIGDTTCGISGGRSLRDTFVKNNGCTAQSPPEPANGSKTHTCTKYQGCKDGYPVEWCAFDGGHTPGMVDGGGDDGAKTWTKGEAWKFFTQF
jgi:poly(3-hydroxybutyrate) depolymerase